MSSSSLLPARTLYLCYFGLREPLVQTQVLPYLRLLADKGMDVYLLTFEPRMGQSWTAEQQAIAQVQLSAQGIHWFFRVYHKRPSALATAYDILIGAWFAAKLGRQRLINVLHARAHVPLAMALLAQKFIDCRIIFDVRGFVADEYADAGVWRKGSLAYRAVKWLERAGLRRADQIVVLTRRMRNWVIANGYAGTEKIEVIPCCVDFGQLGEERLATVSTTSPRFELAYAGAATGLYLLEEMAHFFLVVQALRPDAFLQILTQSSVREVKAILHRVGLKDEDFSVGQVPPAEVRACLSRARLGLSFRKPGFAQIASSPTKIAEYLSAGLPVVSNAGIGDMDELLEHERVGVVLQNFDDGALRSAAKRALELVAEVAIRARCVEVARRHFDLVSVGGVGYENVYRRIQLDRQVLALPEKITELG